MELVIQLGFTVTFLRPTSPEESKFQVFNRCQRHRWHQSMSLEDIILQNQNSNINTIHRDMEKHKRTSLTYATFFGSGAKLTIAFRQ
eukprot:6477864-Amphidinium_carterae.1